MRQKKGEKGYFRISFSVDSALGKSAGFTALEAEVGCEVQGKGSPATLPFM